MGELDLDWDKIIKEQEADAAVLPEHEYDITVVKAEATQAKSGSPMIKLACDVTSGPFKNKRLWTNIVFKSDNPGAMRMSLRKLAGLGLSREWLAENNPSTEAIARALAGKTAVAKVTQREWNGEMHNDIDMFKNTGDGMAPPPPSISSPPNPEAGLPPVAPAPEPAPAEPATTDEVATNEKDPF